MARFCIVGIESTFESMFKHIQLYVQQAGFVDWSYWLPCS